MSLYGMSGDIKQRKSVVFMSLSSLGFLASQCWKENAGLSNSPLLMFFMGLKVSKLLELVHLTSTPLVVIQYMYD